MTTATGTFGFRSMPRLLAAAGCLLAAQGAWAADYYVDGVKGSDSNNGASATPFKSFWPLMHVLQPGDTAHIAPGTYTSGLYITVSGVAGKPIVFTGSSSTNLPVIKLTTGYPIQFANGVSYVNVKYFNVTTADKSGIWASGGNHHLGIAYNVAHDCFGAGIGGSQSDYLTIHHNTVYNNSWPSNQDPSGIDIYELKNYDNGAGYHNYIQSNIVYNNANKTPLAGKTYTTDGNGIIIDDSRHTQHGSVGAAYTGTTLIENNVVFNNGGRGIHVYLSDNVLIRNNSVYHNNWDPKNVDFHAGEIEAYASGNVKVYNNIMVSAGSGAHTQHVAFSAQRTTGISTAADYNLTYGSPAYYRDSETLQSWGSHNKTANPQFLQATTDPGLADFRLKSTRPAIGLSNPSVAPKLDILNTTRSQPVTDGAYQRPVY